MKNLSYLLMFALLFACSIFKAVNVSDNREKGKQSLVSVELGLNVITSDLATLTTAIEKGRDVQAKNKLAKLTFSQRTIIQNYVRTKEDFESSRFKNRDRIAAEDKDYLESKGIYRVDGRTLNRDFIQALNDSKKTQLAVKNELMDYNVKLNQSTESEEKKKSQKTTIQELVKIVERMENVTFRLQRVHVATSAEVGTGVKYVTPGMRSHKYLDKIKSLTDMVSLEEKNFHDLAKSLSN